MTRYLASLAATGHVIGVVDGETYAEALGRAIGLAAKTNHPEQRLQLDLVDDEPPALVKRCGCGVEYDAARWRALPLVYRHDDGIESFEAKNCPACLSTLAVHPEALG